MAALNLFARLNERRESAAQCCLCGPPKCHQILDIKKVVEVKHSDYKWVAMKE